MNIIRRRGWEIPERLATPEHLFFDRRAFLAATVAGAATLSLARPDPFAALDGTSRIIRIEALPTRRGPAVLACRSTGGCWKGST